MLLHNLRQSINAATAAETSRNNINVNTNIHVDERLAADLGRGGDGGRFKGVSPPRERHCWQAQQPHILLSHLFRDTILDVFGDADGSGSRKGKGNLQQQRQRQRRHKSMTGQPLIAEGAPTMPGHLEPSQAADRAETLQADSAAEAISHPR
jgi:hypothetical protein